MKKSFFLFLLVIAGASFQRCADESQDELNSSQISFEIGVADQTSGTDLVSHVVLVLQNPNGSVAFNNQLNVTSKGVGTPMLTEQVKLLQGEYRIRELSARNAEGNVLFALTINHATRCEGDKNLLKTFYAGSGTKTISISLSRVNTSVNGGS